jgi:multiple sugar transport system substrate-binding protein
MHGIGHLKKAAAGVAMALFATACIGGGNSSSSPPPKTVTVTEPTSPVKVQMVIHSGADFSAMATAFHKLHPNITIEISSLPAGSMADKLTTEIAGGTAPDVVYMDTGLIQSFAARNALVDLQPYINQSKVVTASDYVPSFRQTNTYNGDMYGLPFDGESTGLFYRTDLFQAAGITSPPTTWAELQADAAKLTIPSKKQYGWEEWGPESAYYWYPFLWQAGGQLLNSAGNGPAFDSAAGDEAANFYIGLKKYSPPDYYNSNSWDGRISFEQGQVAMYEAGDWFGGTISTEAPQINGKWAAAPLPKGPTGDCGTTIAGDSLAVLNGTKNTDAAWLWIEYLSEPQNIKHFNIAGKYSTLLPPVTSLLQNQSLYTKKPWLQQFASNMACGSTGAQNPNWTQVEDILNNEFSSAIYGKITPAQALDVTSQKATSILAGGGTPTPSASA